MSDFQGILDACSDGVFALDAQLNILAINTAAAEVFSPSKMELNNMPLQAIIGDNVEEQKLITAAGLYSAIHSSSVLKNSTSIGVTIITTQQGVQTSTYFAVVELRAVKAHPAISWLLVFRGIETYDGASLKAEEELSKQALTAEIEKLRAEQKLWLNNFHDLQLSIEQQVVAQQAVLLSRETDLLQKITALEKENHELEKFNYLVIHDLQEPLRSMISFGDLIFAEADKELTAQTQSYLNYIADSAKRMQTLVAGLLKYAALGNESQLQALDCNLVIEELMQDLAAAIAESGIIITCAKLPIVNAYPVELKSVFLNLISNAIKFRNRNLQAKVSVEAFDAGKFWRFEIKDNGIGIDPKHHKNIFVLFKRFHRQADLQGSGIGLALCKKVIALHNGEIWSESLDGGGTGFFFTLPK